MEQKLISGILKFQTEVYPRQQQVYQKLAKGQSPDTLFIGCSDSRVMPNEFLQVGPGELFICRNAGNIVPPHGDVLGGVSATVEYAIEVLQVKHVVICGHSDCGAMKAIIHPEKVAKYRAVAQWLRHAERVQAVAAALHNNLSEEDFLKRVIEENVITQIDNLMTHPSVAARARTGQLSVHGLVYDIASGDFRMLDRRTQSFHPVHEFASNPELQSGYVTEREQTVKA